MHPLISLHGSTAPLPEKVFLRAGELNLIYESGFLRYIKSGDTEIVRLINHYIRDTSWANVPMTILSESIKKTEASFSIDYEALCQDGDIQFKWNCRIRGGADSSITFDIEGEALETFKRNRLGFTVLQASDSCAGMKCTVVHSDKTREVVTFPDYIEPFQPFFDITGMQWHPTPGVEAILEFTDEVFEPEDQRNWGDASYKIYCTPLVKPFPATVAKGDSIRQGIYLKVNRTSPLLHQDEKQIDVTIDSGTRCSFPAVGVLLNDLSLKEFTKQSIAALEIDFLRVDVRADEGKINTRLTDAIQFNLPLDIALFFSEDSSTDVIDELVPFASNIRQFLIFPEKAVSTDQHLIDRVAPLLRKKFPKAKVGGGSDTFFTELNRQPTPTAQLDFLSFPFTPQAHAADMLTMTENLVALPDTIRSCRNLADGKDIHVTSVSLKTRWKPGASKQEKRVNPWGLPASVDPRQLSLYAAGWTIGCFKYLAESSTHEITFYETSGWRGMLSHPEQRWPADFLFSSPSVYPMYLVLREILSYKHCHVLKLVSNEPLKIDGVAFHDDKGNEIVLIANLTEHDQAANLSGEHFTQSWSLHEANIQSALASPLTNNWETVDVTEMVTLPPFAIRGLKRRVSKK